MRRKVTYWVSTGLLATLSVVNGFIYLSGSQLAVQDFTHLGYPQQLRIILGIAKVLGAITLIVPGLAELKVWAYAGFTFAWISAFVGAGTDGLADRSVGYRLAQGNHQGGG